MNFYNISKFPNVIGAIDGTHVPIIAPAANEHLYICRKNFHSLNVQAICDENMIFTDIVVKWPGSSHDSFILQQSNIYDKFESGQFGNSLLLGDSGYPLKKWLMTPISNPNGTAAERYNIAHKKTRVIIEKAFGVLKQRWRILDHTGGKLCYTPLKVAKIIVCCVILHNMCRRNNVPLPSNGRIYPVPDTDDTAAQDDFEPTAESVRSAIVSSFS
nr:putative nuclease HARBI1 [Styela clava]